MSEQHTIELHRQVKCVSCGKQFSWKKPIYRQTSHGKVLVGEPIECRRCGVNNLNWYVLQHELEPKFTLSNETISFASFLPFIKRRFSRFPLILLLVPILIASLFEIYQQLSICALGCGSLQYLVYIGIFLASIIPALSITNYWRHIREESFLREANFAKQAYAVWPLTTLQQLQLKYLFLYALCLPLVLWLMLGINSALNYYQYQQKFPTSINEIPPSSQPETTITETTPSSLTTYQIIPVNWEERFNSMNTSLFKIAMLFGVVTFFSVFLSGQAIKSYINKINPILPPPLYTNHSRILKVAQEEIQNLLKVNNMPSADIEWVDVGYHERGGLLMCGIQHKDDTSFSGSAMITYTFFVRTNRWAEIISWERRSGDLSDLPHPLN